MVCTDFRGASAIAGGLALDSGLRRLRAAARPLCLTPSAPSSRSRSPSVAVSSNIASMSMSPESSLGSRGRRSTEDEGLIAPRSLQRVWLRLRYGVISIRYVIFALTFGRV